MADNPESGLLLPVIFRDDLFVVFNKPPGIVVNRAQSVSGLTVADLAEKMGLVKFDLSDSSEENREFISRSGLVHRLDRDTSGVLLLARNKDAFISLKSQFMNRSIKKEYLAICHGHVAPPNGEIDAPIARLPWNRERFGIIPEGRPAVTFYQVVKYLTVSGFPLTIVTLFPKTGRTHQIRVHLKHIGHPILGDSLYVGRKQTRMDCRITKRIMLHARLLSFTYPGSGLPVAYEAPIPDDINRLITG